MTVELRSKKSIQLAWHKNRRKIFFHCRKNMQKSFDGRNMIYNEERREIRTQKQLQVSTHHVGSLSLCEIVVPLFQKQMENMGYFQAKRRHDRISSDLHIKI